MRNLFHNLPVAGLAAVLFSIAGAHAQPELTTSGNVSASAIYTDNVCLTPTDEEDQLVWTGTVIPNIAHRREGARLKTNLRMGMTYNSLADSSADCLERGGDGNRSLEDDPERFNPRLRFLGESILLEDWLFFDAAAFADQNKVNAFGQGVDELNGTGNTNTTVSYTLTPYIQRRFKDLANLLVRYSYNDQYNSSEFVEDSSSDRWNARLSSGADFEPLSFGLNGDYRKVEYDQGEESELNGQGEESELKSASVFARYQINRSWQVDGEAGEEWNDFSSVENDTDGFFWDAGARWTPNTRVSMGAGYGERFYGETKRFDATYSHKRSNIRATYRETITFNRDIRTLDESGEDIFVPDLPPTGIPPGFGGSPTTLSTGAILDKRFTLSYGVNYQRTNISVDGSLSEQTQQESGRKSEFTSIGVDLRRSLSPRISMNTSVRWYDDQAVDDSNPLERNSDTWLYSLGASRSVGSSTNMSLNYQFIKRNSDFFLDEYEENRVIFTVTYALFNDR